MSLILQPVRVANGHDEKGVLVFTEDRLLAVLVQLSDEHEEQDPDDGLDPVPTQR